MLSNPKTRSLYSWLLLILILQLAVSVGAFYWHNKFHTRAIARATEPEKLEARLRDIKCDSINKAAVVDLMKSSVVDDESVAELLFSLGLVSALSTGFVVLAIVDIKRNTLTNIRKRA